MTSARCCGSIPANSRAARRSASPRPIPFVATVGARPEIYALGLRNPFRASFAPNGDLILPDVGQATWEEVNVGRATATPAATTLAGANLGWPTCEAACSPPDASFVDPIFQYLHGSTETTGCAIIGGYVVRDPALEGLTGRYLYGDYCRQDLRTLDLGAPGADPRSAGVSIPAEGGELLGFGEDGRGCVYVMTDVTAYRVAESPAAGRACPAAGGPCRTRRLRSSRSADPAGSASVAPSGSSPPVTRPAPCTRRATCVSPGRRLRHRSG